jgi:hypothetical protein
VLAARASAELHRPALLRALSPTGRAAGEADVSCCGDPRPQVDPRGGHVCGSCRGRPTTPAPGQLAREHALRVLGRERGWRHGQVELDEQLAAGLFALADDLEAAHRTREAAAAARLERERLRAAAARYGPRRGEGQRRCTGCGRGTPTRCQACGLLCCGGCLVPAHVHGLAGVHDRCPSCAWPDAEPPT